MLLERKERIDQTIGVPLTARYPPASTLVESVGHEGAAPHVSIRSTVSGPPPDLRCTQDLRLRWALHQAWQSHRKRNLLERFR